MFQKKDSFRIEFVCTRVMYVGINEWLSSTFYSLNKCCVIIYFGFLVTDAMIPCHNLKYNDFHSISYAMSIVQR